MLRLVEVVRRGAVVLAVACVMGVVSQTTVAADAGNAERSRLARLDASVQAAEAVRAVKRLQHSYSHFLSDGLWNDVAVLLTDDATAQFAAGTTIKGRDNIQQYLMQQAGRSQLGLAAGQLNLHLVLQPIITLGADGVSAKGAWHEVNLLGIYGKSAQWYGGIYENDYALDHGVWKISKLNFIQQYEGDYDDYGHKAPPAWNVPYHFVAAHVGVSVPESALAALAVSAEKKGGQDPAALSQRIERMQDETAVENLQHSYSYYLDRKLYDDVADLFTASGTLELDQRGSYRGAAHIRKALATFYGPTPLQYGELFDHINLSTVVTVAGDGLTASARTSQLSELGHNGEYARWEEGTYENRFTKENGVWKLSAVHYFPRFITDYDLGWARDAKPVPAVSTELPPDAPPSQSYASYPAAGMVGYHFTNPVTGKPVQVVKGAVIAVPLVATKSDSPVAVKLSLAELERKADADIAVDAVENLNSSYGYYIDESAWDNMSDTYSLTQGAKELTGAGVYVGQDRIRKALNLRGPAGGRTPSFFTIHQLTQPVIHIADDGMSAKGRFRLFQMGGSADGSSGSWIGGIYENTAVKENGEWKFGIQDLHHLFNASYRNGWARFGTAAAATVGPAEAAAVKGPAGRNVKGGGIRQGLGGAKGPGSFVAQLPPDRKIRSRQYAFPEITEPAFHYRNPVSGRMPLDLLP